MQLQPILTMTIRNPRRSSLMRMIYATIFCLLATVAGVGYSAAHEIPGGRALPGFPHPQEEARADNTDPTDETQVKTLVAHWLYHIAAAVGPRGAQDLVEFRLHALEDRGTWTSDEMSMDLVDSDWNVIYSLQPYNEELQSYGIEGRNIRITEMPTTRRLSLTRT